MKNYLKWNNVLALAILMSGAVAFTACDDDDDDVPVSKVPDAVRDSFRAMFQGVRNAGWEMVSNYYIAEFTYNGFFTEAWYVPDGTWVMTETDYDNQTGYLPLPVQNAFSQSKYAGYVVDDVSLYEKPASSFCVIEVDNPVTDADISLFYDTYGNLLNTVQGDDYEIMPGTDPSTIVI